MEGKYDPAAAILMHFTHETGRRILIRYQNIRWKPTYGSRARHNQSPISALYASCCHSVTRRARNCVRIPGHLV